MAEHSAESDVLDQPGNWSIRVTVYRNGRKVGTCDTTDWETFDEAAYWVGEGLSTREIEAHVPKRRTRPTPPAATEIEDGVFGDPEIHRLLTSGPRVTPPTATEEAPR